MSTNSSIMTEDHSGTVRGVYCHWDGYLSHNGRILLEHYTDRAKVEQLLDLGDISILAPEIGEKHPFGKFEMPEGMTWDKKWDNWVTAYGRDRGETNIDAHTYEDIESAGALFQEYNYVFGPDGQWYWFRGDNPDDMRPLADTDLENEVYRGEATCQPT